MNHNNLFTESGIIITITLILIPVIIGSLLVVLKVRDLIRHWKKEKELAIFKEGIVNLSISELEKLQQRREELDYELPAQVLSGFNEVLDNRGLLLEVSVASDLRFTTIKKKNLRSPNISSGLSSLILSFLGTAIFWLLFGTTVGEYIGIKFIAPDIDHISWLSFGRLRPVHTNAVFWGWCSLAMMGLAYYVIPKVSNVKIYSLKLGYYTMYLINAALILGSILLMAGVNNGGGEYREYIWPVMLLFGSGIALSLFNYMKTIANRKTKEIYVSNWYIVSALMFLLTITIIAYWPTWQNGLGETIVQGYYMHQGVGMWFMLFCLGLVYYFLPQQLNKPIYSYSLGILAFWTQILFYTLIGTHHFIFSAIPWWLQTIAIVGSVGMVIPVIAGTTNFLLTFKGSWSKLSNSYTLPFYLIGIIFYFTGSLQGTAEAFRFTNLIWHFTDFTVAHSHLTMYGIVSFMLLAFIYTLVPRLTGKEPPKLLVGAHFWFALIGLLFYTIPLMIGSTERGLMWMENKPFIETVVHMAPYWLWRAIGGTLMWLSHIIFTYNFYKMVRNKDEIIIPTKPDEILKLREDLN